MAIDEAMLEAAARRRAAYLRFYGWTVPTLSLGYFQRMAEVRVGSSMAGRPGGAAADRRRGDLAPSRGDLCDRRPAGHPARPPEHGALSGRARGDRGSSGERGRPGPPARRARPRASGRSAEIVRSSALRVAIRRISYREDHKLVGSAQRRRDGAVLQHGSILLARSPASRSCPASAMSRMFPRSRSIGESASMRPIAAALDLEPDGHRLARALRERALELERSTLSQPGLDARRR